MISYFKRQMNVLTEALETLDEIEFWRLVREAAGAIDGGHKVIVSGLGKNVPICEKFVGSMVSLGMDAYFLHTNSAVHGDMGIVKDGDLVILLSKSGDTSDSVYLAKLLQERDITMWLLSFTEESTLAKRIPNRIIMRMEHEGDLWNIMPNNSTTLNLIVLQALAMLIAKERHMKIEDFKRNHPGGHIGMILSGENA